MTTRRVLGWLGYSSVDVIGRFVVLIAITAVLARLLPPEDFGVAALVLSIVSLLTTIAGGAPFEEPLVQRRVVRRIHLDAAIGVSFLLAALLAAPPILLGERIGARLGVESLSGPLAFASTILLLNAVWNVMVALARRRRRFDAIATTNLLGHAIGGAVAVGWVVAAPEQGVYALIGFRVVAIGLSAAMLARALRFTPRPRLSRAAFADLRRFAGVSLLERFLENGVYLFFNAAVGAFLGVGALGQLNMAMRIVEPLRGAMIALGHNLAYPFVRAVVDDAEALRAQILATISSLTLIGAPAFLGIAATAPLLIPIVAGPGWDEAAAVSIYLAIGGSLVAMGQALYTAMQAAGRPEINLARRVASSAAMVGALFLALPLGPAAAGLARAIGDGVECAFSAGVGAVRLRIGVGALARAALLPWTLAATMALGVHALGAFVAAETSAAVALAAAVPAGVLAYGALLALAAPEAFARLRGWFGAARGRPAD